MSIGHTSLISLTSVLCVVLGQLFADLKSAGITYTQSREDFLDKVLFLSQQSPAAKFAQNGFWSDHWTYLLDLITNYLSVYPEREESLLFGTENSVPFFMSPAYVRPRAERYSLVNNEHLKSGGSLSTVQVINFLAVWGDPDFSPAR